AALYPPRCARRGPAALRLLRPRRNRVAAAARPARAEVVRQRRDDAPLRRLGRKVAPLTNDSRCSGRTAAANSHGLRALSGLATLYAMRGRNEAPKGCCRAPSRWCPGVGEALPREQNPCSGQTVNHAMGL